MLVLSCHSKVELQKKSPVAHSSKASPAPAVSKRELKPTQQQPQLNRDSSTRLSGEVVAINKSMLGFQVAGFISQVHAKVGAHIQKGDPLAELDNRQVKLQVRAAQARLSQAKAKLAMSSREFAREKALKEANVSSQAAFERSQAQFQMDQAMLQQANADISLAQKALDDSILRAPFDCVVSRQMKFVGDAISVGLPVFEIVDRSTPEIVLDAPESLLGKIQTDTMIEIWIPALQIKTKSKVKRVLSVVLPEKRVFQVVTELLEPDPRIVPGYFVEGLFTPSP